MGISSPLLKQAGFVRSKLAVVGDVFGWVAELDGLSQSWQLSVPIVINGESDFRISFKMIGTNEIYEGLFENSNDDHAWMRLQPPEQEFSIQGYDGQSYIAAARYSHYDLRNGESRLLSFVRTDGKLYVGIDDGDLVYSRTTSEVWAFDRLGKYLNTTFGGVIYGFEVEIDGIVTNAIPLTNKAQGATQLPTVGDISAFMPNYTAAVWKKNRPLV